MNIHVSLGHRDELIITCSYSADKVKKIKQIEGHRYHVQDRYWTIPADPSTLHQLVSLFRKENIIAEGKLADQIKHLQSEIKLSPLLSWLQNLCKQMDKELILKGYSIKTRKVYIAHMKRMLLEIKKQPQDLSPHHIQAYLFLYFKIKNDLIRMSIKRLVPSNFSMQMSYTSLSKKLTFRPKKEHKLPNVLSEGEVQRIFEQVHNLKHRVILMMIYAAGLRVGEVVRLKVQDTDTD